MIDLRSDTVTLPPDPMRDAMGKAPIGDDVYGEDQSVNQLERLAAEILGKEAAMYVPTGTMGNLSAHFAHSQAGTEYICSVHAHTFVAEVGGPSRLAGMSVRTIPQTEAELDPHLVESAIREPDIHYPRTSLIWVEQPTRGYVMDIMNLAEISSIASQRGIPIHMDGARIF